MKLSLVVASLIVGAVAQGNSAPSSTPGPPDDNTATACAVLSASYASHKSAHPKETAYFKPSEVYACQRDVPLVPSLAAAQVEWMQGFIQFQSTLAWLENPPAGYDLPPVDLVAGLESIATKATSGQYQNEYDFEYDIYNLISAAGDGHLAYLPFLIGGFAYVRNVALVSLSVGGLELPKIYFLPDIQAAYSTEHSSFTPSALISINGQDANTYVEQNGYDSKFQDLDARFNLQFYNPSTSEFGNGGLSPRGAYFSSQSVYHEDTSIYVFENGTKRSYQNQAIVGVPLDFNRGQDILEKYIISSPSKASASSPASASAMMSATASSSSASATGSSSVVKQLPSYPYPEVIHSGGYISSYFLKGANYSDVAVLSIPSFLETQENSLLQEFQDVVQTFLGKCQAAKKTTLIIDLRGNPGGTALLAYDLFKQLFPTLTPYSGTRIRGSPAANAIGKQSSKLTAYIASNATTGGAGTFYDYHNDLKSPVGAPFTSWEGLYGPVHLHGDIFSNVAALKLSDAALDIDVGGIVVSGYANNTAILPQVFTSENITLLTDVACTSTCAIFANLLINQGRVKTVVAGGRPSTNPIAVIGGSQGAQSEGWDGIAQLANGAITITRHTTGNDSAETKNAVKVLEPLTQDPPLKPYMFGQAPPTLNLMDNIAKGDKTLTPLQFTKKLADCRFFYMPGDVFNVTYTWERVARGMKGGKGFCINGGVGSTSTGNGTASTTTDRARASTTASPLVYTGGADLASRWSVHGFALTGALIAIGVLWPGLL